MQSSTIFRQSAWAIVLCARRYLLLLMALLAIPWVAPQPSQLHAEEEPVIDAVWNEPSGDETRPDIPFALSSYECIDNCHNGQCNSCRDCAAYPRPVNMLLGPYFKSGVNFVLRKGLLSESREAGYSIVGGVRQPIFRGLGSTNTFIDFGGSYLSAFGTLTREVIGEEFSPPLVPGSSPVPEGPIDVISTLDEVRRAGIHCGWGRYWGPPLDDCRSDPQVRFSTTLGGRLTHVRGEFIEEPTVAIPPENWFKTSYSKTDTAGGLYCNAQLILLRRNSAMGDLQWTFDAELAHDWVDLQGYEERGLGTASILFGFLLTR